MIIIPEGYLHPPLSVPVVSRELVGDSSPEWNSRFYLHPADALVCLEKSQALLPSQVLFYHVQCSKPRISAVGKKEKNSHVFPVVQTVLAVFSFCIIGICSKSQQRRKLKLPALL